MGESPAQLLPYFRYEHLPPRLQRISTPFALVARWVASFLPDTPQTRLGLQKLIEAKDCIVRGSLDAVGDGAAPTAFVDWAKHG